MSGRQPASGCNLAFIAFIAFIALIALRRNTNMRADSRGPLPGCASIPAAHLNESSSHEPTTNLSVR
jgi:hypothetical protein